MYLGGKEPSSEEQPLQGLSVEETEILRRLSEKQMRYAAKGQEKDKDIKELPLEQIYMENLQVLQESS